MPVIYDHPRFRVGDLVSTPKHEATEISVITIDREGIKYTVDGGYMFLESDLERASATEYMRALASKAGTANHGDNRRAHKAKLLDIMLEVLAVDGFEAQANVIGLARELLALLNQPEPKEAVR